MKQTLILKSKLVNIHKLVFLNLLFQILSSGTMLFSQEWTLEQCIDTSMVNNRNLKIASNSAEIAEQKHNETIAALFPKISMVSDFRYFTEMPSQLMPASVFGGPDGVYKAVQFGVPYNINFNVQATLPLFNSQILSAIKTTGLMSQAVRLQYRKTEEQVIYDISVIYYNIQIASHQLRNTDSSLVNSQRLLANTKVLNSQGLVKGSDVEMVEVQLSRLQSQRINIETTLSQLYSALKFNMGVTDDTELTIDPDISYTGPGTYPDSPVTESLLADIQARVAANELKTARRSVLPVISAYSSYGQTGFGYRGKPENFLDFYPVSSSGVQMIVPLFSGTATMRKISQKKGELKNAELQADLMKDMLTLQAANARNRINSYMFLVQTASEQEALAGRVYNQVLVQHEQGTATLADVLMADNTLREAQQNHLSAITEFLKSELELRKATGNLLNSK